MANVVSAKRSDRLIGLHDLKPGDRLLVSHVFGALIPDDGSGDILQWKNYCNWVMFYASFFLSANGDESVCLEKIKNTLREMGYQVSEKKMVSGNYILRLS
jgi:hypothetical protein